MFKAGIIGTGRIGFLLEYDKLRTKPCTHAGALAMSRRVRITCACDIDPLRLQLFQRRYNIRNVYSQYRQLLKEERPDILVISTWTDSHEQICQEASQAGIPLIVCEKPMSFHARSARKMYETCLRNRTILIINHERRYDPLYRKTKDIIRKKRIGEVHTVLANVLTQRNFNKKSFQMDKSSLLHDATHLIDISLFLFHEVRHVQGFIPDYRKDTAYGHIEFKNGVNLFLESGGDRNYFNFELDIQATRGRMRVGNEYQEMYLRKKSRQYSGFWELEKVPFPPVPRSNPFLRLYEEAVDLLEGRKKTPSSSGLDGLLTMEIIERIAQGSKIL